MERNHRTRHGEIDLILREGPTLVFVEVKARRGRGYGDPLEAVTAGKQDRLRRMADAYLSEKGTDFTDEFDEIRFDAVGIVVSDGGREIQHVQDAF